MMGLIPIMFIIQLYLINWTVKTEKLMFWAIIANVFGILSNKLLLAIPFFTLMGTLLEKCGLAEDMLDSMGQLFGPVRGGLGYSVILVGFILGAITGTVAGQVIAMAMISLPVMIRYGYNMRYATGVLAASGTITQLVPPSLVLVVMADQLGRSVGDMYKGQFTKAQLAKMKQTWSTKKASDVDQRTKDFVKNLDQFTQMDPIIQKIILRYTLCILEEYKVKNPNVYMKLIDIHQRGDYILGIGFGRKVTNAEQECAKQCLINLQLDLNF